MPAPPNPYFIYIELVWPDGHLATQNEIARVIAYDVNPPPPATPTAVTNEGQSGHNPAGGWQPIFMQNFAAFYPPREKPNLKFEVISTAEVLVFTTQVFSNIPSETTVRIVIGQGASIPGGGGGGPTTFTVTGHASRQSNGGLFTPGAVEVFDVTNNSSLSLGATALTTLGDYSVSFTSDQFKNNGGVFHTKPNLLVRLTDITTGQLLDESGPHAGWNGQPIDLSVDDTVPVPPQRRVFGNVTNALGLPVAGITVQAFDVVWTTAGIQELPLGTTVSDGAGGYSINYEVPTPPGSAIKCGPTPDQVNILVRAVSATPTSPPTSPPTFATLGSAGVFFDAPLEQRADLVVSKTAVSTDSEYTQLNAAISSCFGATDAARFSTFNQVNGRPELLTFVAESSGQSEDRVRAYVKAWLIALEIATKVPNPAPTSPPASPPTPVLFQLILPSLLPPGANYGGSPEVMYALVRDGLGGSLSELLNIEPDAFFDAVVNGIHTGIISASIEARLRPTSASAKDSLVDDWRTVLAKMMTRAPGGDPPQWQQQLLALALPDASPAITGAIGTATLNQDTAQVHNVTMPLVVGSGDLLLVLFTIHSTATLAGTPGGWSIISNATNANGPIRFTVFAKVAAGTEANQVISFTNIAGNSAAHVIRIAQGTWAGSLSDVTVATPVTNSTANTSMDPPAATWPWSTSTPAATLFFACGGINGNATATSPASYSTPALRTPSGAGAPCATVSAQRLANDPAGLGLENPGAFVLSPAAFWVATTIAIRPASYTAKREAVAKAHFDTQGSFDDLISFLKLSTNPVFTALDLENLRFVLELYDKVNRYYPIVASVFAGKASKPWKTIRDLATVTLPEWTVFAFQSQPFSTPSGQLPAELPGATPIERGNIYGQRLFDLFGGFSPQDRFVAGLLQSPPNAGQAQIAAFLQANPTFKLESTNIDVFNAALIAANVASPPASPPTAPLPASLVPQMKQLQRVYRLTNDIAAARALITNGFDSAVKISQMEEGAFIASQEQFVGGLSAAREIHRTASHYTSEVLFNVVKFHQNVNEVGGMQAVTGPPNFNVSGALATIDPTEGYLGGLGALSPPQTAPSPRKLPNWTTLFGSLSSCTCTRCQTALSPGAYLVDLLEFINGGPRKPLLDRRADLTDIQITCSNTFTTLPYIDLVNEILEGAVTPASFQLTSDAGGTTPVSTITLQNAAGGDATAFGLVKTAFQVHGTVLGSRAVIKTGIDDDPAGVRVWTVQDDAAVYSIRGRITPYYVYPSLVAPRAFPLIGLTTSPPGLLVPAATLDSAATGNWSACWQIRQAFADRGYPLGEKAVVRRSAEDHPPTSPPAPASPPLERVWVVEDEAWIFTVRGATAPFIVYPSPQTSATNDSLEVFPEHVTAAAYDVLATAVFPFNLPLALGKEEANILLRAKNVRQHEILEAFTVDSRDAVISKGTGALAYLDLSTSEANAILAPAGPAPWGFDTESVVQIVRPDQPTLSLQGTWLDLLTLVPVFLHRSGLTYPELLDLLDTAFVQKETAAPGLHISATPNDLQDCDFNEFQIAHLNHPTTGKPTLRRISFFLRLWRKLGWSMRDVDTYLMALESGNIPADLKRVFQVKRLVDELQLEPRAAIAFWSNVDNRRSVRNPKSLFDETFLVGTAGQPELIDLENVARGQSVPIGGTAPPNAGEDLRAHVRGALRLKADEIDLLWPTSGTIDLARLSQMFRIATFSHALELSVVDYFDLVALTGVDPFPLPLPPLSPPSALADRILAAFTAIREIRRERSTSMTAAETRYYLTDFSKTADPFVPSRDAIAAAAQRLSLAVGDITASLPDVARPDATQLSTLLGKVVPTDKVVRVVTIITPTFPPPTSPPAPPIQPSAADRALVKRYFAPFLGPDPGADNFLTALFAEPDAPTRFASVFQKLNAYLLDQAKTTAVVNATSELFETDRDTIDILLTKALGPALVTSPPRASAMDDWKAFLTGGWDTGDPAIVNLPPRTWKAVIVVPKSGVYRFVASAAADGVLGNMGSITIDDGTFAFVGSPKNPPAVTAASPPNGTTLLTWDPVTLRAGTVINVTFTYSGPATVTLMWRIDNADAVVIPNTATLPFTIFSPLNVTTTSPPGAQPPPVQPPAYLKLYKATRLVKGLNLSRPELRHLIELQPPLPASPPNPQALVFAFNRLPALAGAPVVPWADLAAVVDLLDLNRTLTFKAKTLFEFWRDVATPTIDDVANLTGWKVEDVQAVRTLWTAASPPLTVPSYRDPAIWYVLRATMGIVNRLDLRAARILEFLVRAEPTAQSVAALRNIIRAQFTKKEWKEIFKPLRDPLRQRQRDALVGYLTTRSILLNGKIASFFDANDLFSYLLIDVEMETDTLISRMVLALNSAQLFVDRVFLGLEDTATFADIETAKQQWGWMNRFRVWEANRKVFLFPENYIEPELRDDKTPFFLELEEELLQDSVSNEKGVLALTNYIEKMNDVANLEVVGSYAEETFSSGVNYILHIVARSRSEARTFYYRTFEGKQATDGSWTPWKQIPLEINADVVAPVVFNGHLHLYWPMIRLRQKPLTEHREVSGQNVGGEPRTQYVLDIRLMSTEYISKQNKWLKPKRTKVSAIDTAVTTPFNEDEDDDEKPPTDHHHIRVSALGPEYVSIDLIRTVTPTTLEEQQARQDASGGWRGRPTTPGPDPDRMLPLRLGTFTFWYTGEETFTPEPFSRPRNFLSLGKNYPIGTVLRHNLAVEVDIQVEGQRSKDQFQFKDNIAFLQKTPGTFSVFETNFGYLEPEENRPFFYQTDTKNLFAINKGLVTVAGLSQPRVLTAQFYAFHHPLVRELQKILHVYGPSGLMNRLTEALPLSDNRYYSNYYYNYYGNLYLGYHIAGDTQAFGTAQRMFETEHNPRTESVVRPYALPTIEFGYGTPFGVYNWELFFHLPMMVAGKLSQDLQFEQALQWYHYVFDPKQGLNTYEQTRAFPDKLPLGARYWTFLPLFANKNATDSLLDTLGLSKTLSDDEKKQLTGQIDDWRRNPFKPHLVARTRIQAYQKFVVMKYLDNLINWGDALFRQDSFESINQATQLYILADDILGQRPQPIDSLAVEQKLTARELQAQGIDEFSNAVVEVEYQIVTNSEFTKEIALEPQNSATTPIRSIALRSFFFQIPRNEELDRFWNTVADRLFKIRNSMNIDGIKRQLALFQPPINPALLVRAAAAGLDLSSVISQLNTPLPHYRFNVWMQKAVDVCNELKSFGAEFLAALEKKDAEALQLLRQGHEIRMLQLARRIRVRQVAEAEGNIVALELSKAIAEDRRNEYHNRAKISGQERSQFNLTTATTVLETIQGGLHALAALFAPIPDSKAGMVGPFATALIDIKVGTALSQGLTSGASAVGAAASLTRGLATAAGMNAGFERRWEDFKLQERQAGKEMVQIDQQIAVANIRLNIAEQELDNQDTQIDQSNEVLDFLKSKFTSRDLYNFMVTQLSRTFQQVYKLAFDAAKTAERTFQFELGVEDSYIQFGYQDSLHKGLLAGETLIHDLKRMEVAYLERYKREYEIQKPISLAVLNGEALQQLREKGTCEFVLPEIIFDLDFPGQYFRRIKGVQLTVPCVTGPHTSVSAKLTLLSSTFRKDATAPTANKYPYTGPDDSRFVQDPVGIQAIAGSTGQNDAGLFEFNFRDERYLPFEGAGAISTWRLELPTQARQFDYNTISDVVMRLSYTAREGGGLLKAAAEFEIHKKMDAILGLLVSTETGLVRAFSLRREFPDLFHKILFPGSPPSPAVMTLVPEHFPFVFQERRMPITVFGPASIKIVAKVGKTAPPGTVTIGSATTGTTTGPFQPGTGLVTGGKPTDLALQSTLVVGAPPPAPQPGDVEDIVVIIPYKVGAGAST